VLNRSNIQKERGMGTRNCDKYDRGRKEKKKGDGIVTPKTRKVRNPMGLDQRQGGRLPGAMGIGTG